MADMATFLTGFIPAWSRQMKLAAIWEVDVFGVWVPASANRALVRDVTV